MSILGGSLARRHVPRTPVLARVSQTVQMSILGGSLARRHVPRTPVLVRVLQRLQIAEISGIRARPLVPRRPVLVRELHTNRTWNARSPRARRRIFWKDSPLVVRFKIPATVANRVPLDAIASQIL